mmetsp:Transcript_64804/g.208691  ORF Transcript_64804/g.208691 Transcript_64804/m.208691 type:complete len:354 (-) Transcript_64804:957-2018(-)
MAQLSCISQGSAAWPRSAAFSKHRVTNRRSSAFSCGQNSGAAARTRKRPRKSKWLDMSVARMRSTTCSRKSRCFSREHPRRMLQPVPCMSWKHVAACMFSRMLRSLYRRAISMPLLAQNRLFRPKWPTSCASAATSVAICSHALWPPQARPRTASQCVEWATTEAWASLWNGFGCSSYFWCNALVKRRIVPSVVPSSVACFTTSSSAMARRALRPVRSLKARVSSTQLWSPPVRRSSSTSTLILSTTSYTNCKLPVLLAMPSSASSTGARVFGGEGGRLEATMSDSMLRSVKLFLMKCRRLLLILLFLRGVCPPKSCLASKWTAPSRLEIRFSARLRRSWAKPSSASRVPAPS